MQTVLVTGGAGYIGSIACRVLHEAGYRPVIFDNLEYGHAEAIRGFDFYRGDLRRADEINRAVALIKPDAVMHFAAYLFVNESVEKPIEYFENNVLGTLNLCRAMIQANVKKLVFSSTCATYGQPEKLPVREDEKERPESPYGETKLAVERMLEWFLPSYQLSSIRLRYFNVAGAWSDGSLGEHHEPEIHIIPLAIFTAQGKRPHFTIYGTDYPTRDGTCIRDYIHVVDLAKAHVKALERLDSWQGTEKYNIGVGQGYSNKEVVEMVKKVSAKDFIVNYGPPRVGDPAEIYADSTKAQTELNWQPELNLEDIVSSAWKWHSLHPEGYR